MILFFTFGFVRSSEDAVRPFVEMNYVAGDNLDNFVRLRFVLEVHFTYAVQLLVIRHITLLFKHVRLTLDDVCDRWTRVVYGDRSAGGNLTDSSH